MKGYDVLTCAMSISRLLLSYGGEIYRAEQSFTYICKAYGAKSVGVFVVPSCIIASIEMDGEEPITIVEEVDSKEINLFKLDRLNNLSRYICKNKPEKDIIDKKIQSIVAIKNYHPAIIFLAYCFVTSTFTLFFGGQISEILVSFVIGGVMKILLDFLTKINSNHIFTNILCSSVATLIAVFATYLGITNTWDHIIIGSLMTLVPGFVLTNSMRDFMVGDYLAGIIETLETLLIAVGIAIGVALTLSIFKGM